MRYLSIDRISFVLGLVTIASTVLCYFLYRKRLSNAPARLLEISGGAALALTGLVVGRDLTIRAGQFLYRDPIVTSVTTPFQHIILPKPPFPRLRSGHPLFQRSPLKQQIASNNS